MRASERARLESEGHPPPFANAQIAAITATQGLVLVTRNLKDYALFGDITVEDWCR